MEILQKFKSDIYYVLIATDVAARGLDIKSIKRRLGLLVNWCRMSTDESCYEGGKKGRGRGGGGRGARGVDYGLLVLVLDIIRNPVTLLLLHQTLKVQ
ncbi:hypothetical protein V6N12_072973 [Hibiscus sabdariffa]|uniref:Helicase C-terminal domain-containing protein n=1 Tax=Hibiscus sabdariffa TaxID=183260 RepID=A0ABR2B4Q0_9ROSI